jgi:Ras GTPase-activating protein 1
MSFSLTLYNKGKRSKDTEVAELTVELANLTNGEEMDEWYPLSGVTPIGEWGALRLRIRYIDLSIRKRERFFFLFHIFIVNNDNDK